LVTLKQNRERFLVLKSLFLREGFLFSYLGLMNKQQRNKARGSIKKSIKETHKDISSLKELTKPISPENAIGRVSRMDAINNKSVNEAALRNAINKLALLESALQRVNNEDFGLCVRCNTEIPIQRILLIPQSNQCVHCASK
tara:strand:- start:75 stop:500 length:426 start_codon:yes stop_codon:yes gene_type:complete